MALQPNDESAFEALSILWQNEEQYDKMRHLLGDIDRIIEHCKDDEIKLELIVESTWICCLCGYSNQEQWERLSKAFLSNTNCTKAFDYLHDMELTNLAIELDDIYEKSLLGEPYSLNYEQLKAFFLQNEETREDMQDFINDYEN